MDRPFRLIIAGGRDFNNYGRLVQVMEQSSTEPIHAGNLIIVSGLAKGADLLGYQYAIAKGLDVCGFAANWNAHGKAAGFIRNKEMGNFADGLYAFWDSQSRGTKHMIDYMNSLGKPVRIINY